MFPSLDAAVEINTIRLVPLNPGPRNVSIDVTVHRFEEQINGREYLIEVSAVDIDRWRAALVRVPGGSAALMPFYGSTPAEAARQLCDWLIRAHRHAH